MNSTINKMNSKDVPILSDEDLDSIASPNPNTSPHMRKIVNIQDSRITTMTPLSPSPLTKKRTNKSVCSNPFNLQEHQPFVYGEDMHLSPIT